MIYSFITSKRVMISNIEVKAISCHYHTLTKSIPLLSVEHFEAAVPSSCAFVPPGQRVALHNSNNWQYWALLESHHSRFGSFRFQHEVHCYPFSQFEPEFTNCMHIITTPNLVFGSINLIKFRVAIDLVSTREKITQNLRRPTKLNNKSQSTPLFESSCFETKTWSVWVQARGPSKVHASAFHLGEGFSWKLFTKIKITP